MSPRNPLPIQWTETASEDMNGIAEYLLGESLPFYAVEEYVKRIYKAPEHLATLPGAGKPGRVPNTREWLVKDTPYALIYDLSSGKVRILRVMHSSRQFPEQ
jgi:plasmid stabilization system protein ParE